MSLSKFLAALLPLLLAFCCRTTMEQAVIYSPPSPPWTFPPPSPPQNRVLPGKEVKAVNALLRLSRNYGADYGEKFSSTGCGSLRPNEIKCHCNSTRCRVIQIDLSDRRLTGRIPDEIGDFSQLRYLDLSSNKLYGAIPSSFGNLSQLSTVDLSTNNLGGPLPLFISEMKLLQFLYLENNLFNESIPPEFGTLPRLRYLSISNNLLSGRIPNELGNVSSLVTLDLTDNLLSDKLPPHLGNLSKLQYLLLANNNFSGELPSELGKLKQLIYFIIRGNSFNGTIPDFIGNWRNLESFHINNLLGSPPDGFSFPEISNARSLQYLTLRNCSLTRNIPDYIWKSSSLKYLDLSFNNLTGGIPAVVKNPFLQYIFLRRNKLTGQLPMWMLSSNNSFVDVSENHFSNTSISGNKFKNKNLFECCKPEDMHKKWQEDDYYCANNNDHLYINCGGNHTSINGSLYEADLNPDGASTFFLSDKSAWAYSSMGIFLFSTRRRYIVNSGDESSLHATARVSPISLKYYGFCLKDDDYTVRLHFEEIGWDRKKFRYSGIKRRRVFDVEIQGQKKLVDFNIEKEAEGIHKRIIREFNITVNNSRLEIHLYWSGKGSMSSPTPYYGPLISAISVSPVPKKQRKKHPTVMISTTVGSVLLFSIMILGLCWMLGWLGGKRPDGQGVELYPGGVFNFLQIKAATNNFAPDNKLGQGGFGAVYKGKLSNGTEIAVKRLSGRSKQGVREFVNEVGTIFALKHPNLVRLIGCCAEEHQLLLVYEYMENNSLEHALFGAQEVKAKLDWKRRVKICLDVAKGLAYLHEECKLKLIHGDIKPSNILLDKDFNAKISDFGFARTDDKGTVRKNAQPDVNTPVKGTQGYIAPECMKAEYSHKVDVYSFGILTLEIISGKLSVTPNSRGQTIYLLEKAYDYLRQGNPFGLLDSSLESEYNPKEAKNIIYLAMKCINHNPDQRPTMSEVVKILEGKKEINNILVPIPVDDLMMGKTRVAFSQSIHSASTSFEGASDSTIALPTSEEIDESGLYAHYSDERAES